MTGDLWLAIGDETGDWDNKQTNFLGVALVLAKVTDWKSALSEKINNQSVKQRMLKPLTHLPKTAQKKESHHVMEALDYLHIHGEWALDKPSQDKLQQELFANLHWLAKHPRLITIGTYGNSRLVWERLNLANDPAQALGRAYGLLAASIVPFLGDDDTLLVAPASRSEDSSNEAIQRVTLNNQSNQERQHGDARGLISTLLDQSQRVLQPWGLQEQIDSGVFLNLQKQYFNHIFLDWLALDNIADMGAALMSLSQKGNIHLIDPRQTWRNVKFFHIKELLS